VITAATRAPLRIGFAASQCRESLNTLFTNRRVTPPPTAHHVVDRYLSLVEPLGVRAAAVEFSLPTSEAAEERVDDVLGRKGLRSRDRLVVLNPGAGRPDKRWPAVHFRGLARRLVDDLKVSVLVTWGPHELGDAHTIVGDETAGRAALAPPTSLEELLAVLRRASVVVAGDTGPLHMAAALGTPCVGLYGPTSAVRNGPYGQVPRTLTSPNGTMAALTVDAVFRAVVDVLEHETSAARAR